MIRLEMDLDTSGSRDSLRGRPQSLLLASQETTAPLGGAPAIRRRRAALKDVQAAANASIADPEFIPAERGDLAKLDEALARTEEGRLRVAILGQFKREAARC